MPTNPPPERAVIGINEASLIGMWLIGIFGVAVLVFGSFGMGELRGRNERSAEIYEAAGVCDDMNAMGFGDLPGPGGFYTDANCRTIRNIALEKKFYDDGKAD